MLREYIEAMRALWTQQEAAYDGEFVKFGPCWAFPKPAQAHVPLIVGAGGGPKTFAWIARHADGWMTTPGEQDIGGKAAALRQAWAAGNRPGAPDIRVLIAARPTPDDLAAWSAAGAAELIWGLPDAPVGTGSRPTWTASPPAFRIPADKTAWLYLSEATRLCASRGTALPRHPAAAPEVRRRHVQTHFRDQSRQHVDPSLAA